MNHLNLYEAFGDDTFTTEIGHRDVSIYGYEMPEEDSYVESGDMKVIWLLDVDERNSGVKSIGPAVKSVTGFLTLVTPKDDEDEEKQVEFSSDGWEIKVEGSIDFGSGLYPSAVEIDYKKKSIEVSF